jgi:hypothetical protein
LFGENDVRRAADVSEANAPKTEVAGFFGGGTQRQRSALPDYAEAPNPDMEKRMAGAYGISQKGILQKIGEWTAGLWQATTRVNFHIPGDPCSRGNERATAAVQATASVGPG